MISKLFADADGKNKTSNLEAKLTFPNDARPLYPRVRGMAFEPVPCIIEKLTTHRAGPFCG